MKKFIYFMLGLILVPLFILFIIIAIPLFILFLLFLRIFTFRRHRTISSRQPPERTVNASEDIYDIECEVVDEKDQKK